MENNRLIETITDDLIREGLYAAIAKTLKPAAMQKVYPGHFTVTADGRNYGSETTWPGLDSWEMAGAYLLLGEKRLVLDYFDFVQASQRAEGNIPFLILPAEPPPGGRDRFLRGLRYPEDVYAYKPIPHEGQPDFSCMSERKWIGLFNHWQPKANPLSTLGAACYILTAWEILQATLSLEWLAEKIGSVESAGKFLLSCKSTNGFISGSGFYVESPPRYQWDGITQCFCLHAFRLLAEMNIRMNRQNAADSWSREADNITKIFRQMFWQKDHFAEYIHPEYGVVDFHGLSDVNWAAVAFDIATEEQARLLWPLMLAEKALWHGDMPTQLISRPFAYREWEMNEPLPFEKTTGPFYDIAAMGRVWYLETLASLKMGNEERVRDSVHKVCMMGKRHGWTWYERYHPLQVWDIFPAGPAGYCEYAAILTRIVLGNPAVFCKSI